MCTSERVKIFGARAARFGMSLTHSVVILLVFWLLMDIMQTQFRVPAKNLLSATNTNPEVSVTPATDQLVSAMHSYGYHAQKAREAQQEARTDELASMMHGYGFHAQKAREAQQEARTIVPVKLLSCPVTKIPTVVLAKRHPKVENVTRSPKVLVSHPADARGPMPSYRRVRVRVDL